MISFQPMILRYLASWKELSLDFPADCIQVEL